MEGQSTVVKQFLKTCDECGGKFFVPNGNELTTIVCEQPDDALFCSPFCQKLWLDGQFADIEAAVYGGGK